MKLLQWADTCDNNVHFNHLPQSLMEPIYLTALAISTRETDAKRASVLLDRATAVQFNLCFLYSGSHPAGAVVKQTMQQKIVIKVQLKCNKCRSKAMSIAAMASGVLSVQLEGDKRDQVVVIGTVDAAGMTTLLRKKIGHASLEFVDDLKD
ncbi:UNVERIFIED_CONTAM: Disease resistance protein RGA5 [Sesamum calycinum]|uniref:Disease resistance protein RGA5 n=1 Tax=Sesamum calycinum TaxID=2727403 RepID=A0AAW2Q535_9LAMI